MSWPVLRKSSAWIVLEDRESFVNSVLRLWSLSFCSQFGCPFRIDAVVDIVWRYCDYRGCKCECIWS